MNITVRWLARQVFPQGHSAKNRTMVESITFNPSDWYELQFDKYAHLIDRETMRKLLVMGTVGYLFGATLQIDENVPVGKVKVTLGKLQSVNGDKVAIAEGEPTLVER